MALILWNGGIGGAETATAALAEEMIRQGADASVLMVAGGGPLEDVLGRRGVPFSLLGLRTGGELLAKPRRYARLATRSGADGALIAMSGFMGSSLRAGGYSAPIIAVEHGELLRYRAGSRPSWWLRKIDRAIAAPLLSAEVAVSPYMLEHVARSPHAKVLRSIPNGIDTEYFAPTSQPGSDETVLRLGWAGRLVPGKGVDDALGALARTGKADRFHLSIAGTGPDEPVLRELRARLRLDDCVTFCGRVTDMPAFWNGVDVCVACSHQFLESFGMTALEASSCGRGVIATRNGGLAGIVVDDVTGIVVPRGDVPGLAAAMDSYDQDRSLVRHHGSQGRKRAVSTYAVARSAESYLRMFSELRQSGDRRGQTAGHRSSRPSSFLRNRRHDRDRA